MFVFPSHLAALAVAAVAVAVAAVVAVVHGSVRCFDIAVVALPGFHSHFHFAFVHSVEDIVPAVEANAAVAPAVPAPLSERKQSTSVALYPYPQTPPSAPQMS